MSRVVPGVGSTMARSWPASRHLRLVAGRPPGAQPLDDRVQQVARSPAVQAGHGQRLAQAERPQVGDLRLGGGAVHLVGDQEDGHAAAAQPGGDGGVLLGDPDGGVDDEQQQVGVGHRPLGLGDDAGLEPAGLRLPAAGVDQLEAAARPVGLVDDPVAGHAGQLLGDGRAPAEDAVDQGRLADVGSPDHRHPGRPAGGLGVLRIRRYVVLSTHHFGYLSMYRGRAGRRRWPGRPGGAGGGPRWRPCGRPGRRSTRAGRSPGRSRS